MLHVSSPFFRQAHQCGMPKASSPWHRGPALFMHSASQSLCSAGGICCSSPNICSSRPELRRGPAVIRGLAGASRYGIKAGGTAIVMTTLAAGTLPWSDGGRVAFETPRQYAGAPLAATSWAHSRSLDALPLIRDLLLSANQLFVHCQR